MVGVTWGKYVDERERDISNQATMIFVRCVSPLLPASFGGKNRLRNLSLEGGRLISSVMFVIIRYIHIYHTYVLYVGSGGRYGIFLVRFYVDPSTLTV